MRIPRAISGTSKAFLIGCVVFIAACNPSVYKKPAENFRTATTSLKDAYFIELDLSNKARIERGDLEDQIAIWGAPINVVSESTILQVSDNMKKRRQGDIHEQLKPLRKQAFAALEGYSGVLVSLASDEPTEEIVSELNGLVQDIEGVLKMARTMTIAAAHADKLTNFVGPLQQYVGVLNEVIRLASSLIRERAIVKTIGKSNDSIVELLTVLKSEAGDARENTKSQIKKARENLEGFIGGTKLANANNESKAEIAKRIAELQVLEDQINDVDIERAFDAALKAQGALVRKAFMKDPKDWVLQIQAFRERVTATKEAIEKIKSEI